MRKAEEYIPLVNKVSEAVVVDGKQYWNKEFIINLIKQAQLETIEETCKVCAENADIHLIQTWEGIEKGYKNTVVVSKSSILNCVEILKKEIE